MFGSVKGPMAADTTAYGEMPKGNKHHSKAERPRATYATENESNCRKATVFEPEMSRAYATN